MNDYENSTDEFGRFSFNIILKSEEIIDNNKLKVIIKEYLSNIGTSCTRKEGTIIGHIKCYLKSKEDFLKASLVSIKTGPMIVGDTLNLIEQVEFALACIIFGLDNKEVKSIIWDEFNIIKKKYQLFYEP